MRALTKIIFINSAHIRYAEVTIDGNVHFTGTQGVGKTTLLRALLFFYNGRKDKLGIRTQGQQVFDDFYVPATSSYIIYEVTRGGEEPPFSIILFRHHNRAAFRFVDAPYSKDWFVDELGVVASDHITVRQRIQARGIDVSSIIERYTQYLDILYGNRSSRLSKDLLKYYLLRSQQYQNIPRIIQNVFLNERVDAGFIKNIIIDSIKAEDEEITVDLSFYRSKLTHFSEELRDISLWTESNRHGIVETRRDAERIFETSHGIKAAEHSLYEHCGMLNYAVNKAERDIPILQNKIGKKEESVRTVCAKLDELKSGYDRDLQKIGGQIAVLSRDLRKASELKKKYQEMRIDEMIARAGQLPDLKMRLRQKERMQAQLAANYQTVSDKYATLRDRLTLDKDQYLQTLTERKNTATGNYNVRRAERLTERTKLEREIREKFRGLLDELAESLNACRERVHELEMQRIKAESSSPRKEEVAACEARIAETERKLHELAERKLKEENRLESIRNEYGLECQKIEAETAMRIKDAENRIERLETQRAEQQLLLDKVKGSLCEWLDANVEGWEKTIGKIADEKAVLYSQILRPRLVEEEADTVFGISLDLDSIDKEVRTPDMIRATIAEIDGRIESESGAIIRLREERDSRLGQAGKDMLSRSKPVKTEAENTAREIRECQQRAKDERLRLYAIKEEERRCVEETVAEISERIRHEQVKAEALRARHAELDESCNRELRSVNKAITEREKADKLEHEAQIKSLENAGAEYLAEYKARMKRLDAEEAAELTAAGADTRMMADVKKEIEELKKSIDKIDSERETIAVYRSDCLTLLDHVAGMQTEKKKLENDRARLQEKYDERRRRLTERKEEEERSLATLRAAHGRSVADLRSAREFMESKACPAEIEKSDYVATELDCRSIISEIQQLIVETHELTDTLKESVNEFRKRFSPNNTFKFPTVFDTVEDYHRYAESLEDFVANDKIKEFQRLTSRLYGDILSRAAAEFNTVLGREGEITRIIKAINLDFEKKTFAGVIRSIELRLDHSTLPIIVQLQNITDFWNKHQNELGDEPNLFSTDEHQEINRESIKYLKSFSAALNNVPELKKLHLEQTFTLKFRISENDNTTDWVENIRAVGSEGTDILVKAIINILLISVFKKRAGQAGDFRLHCMMDEIGRLADENIQGILDFANQRGILIVNSSPKAHRPLSYRRLYMLLKDRESNTIIRPILSTREAAML